MTKMMKQYTTSRRRFEMAPDGRFIKVYNDGRFSGFIWNSERKVAVDGEEVISSEFFK